MTTFDWNQPIIALTLGFLVGLVLPRLRAIFGLCAAAGVLAGVLMLVGKPEIAKQAEGAIPQSLAVMASLGKPLRELLESSPFLLAGFLLAILAKSVVVLLRNER